MSLTDNLTSKIKTLSEVLWERRALGPQLELWLANYRGLVGTAERERIHALFLLSNFLYFGEREMRELIRALYRDLYKYPIIEELRRSNDDTIDSNVLSLFLPHL
jgi:hypothetical protein